ncbi:hypothetical protein CAC42_6376 [Sphaceloma murrayae]|uniref:Uncharacterized protein n=1 Tax=Sphaceloma murrayae TaxID=2082308 RepID=A0A2K1QMY4_9PEZI|nr:hypothetical protein CAC42_6376 [Sphaceloma murrayae]
MPPRTRTRAVPEVSAPTPATTIPTRRAVSKPVQKRPTRQNNTSSSAKDLATSARPRATVATKAVRGKRLAQKASEEEDEDDEDDQGDEDEDVTNGLVRNAKARRGRGTKLADPQAFIAGGLGSPSPSKGGQEARDEEEDGDGDEYDVPTSQGVADDGTRGRDGTNRKKTRGTRSPAARRTPGSAKQKAASKNVQGGAGSSATKVSSSSLKRSEPLRKALVEATPLAVDSSVAALANFRRRPRQPSLLAMVRGIGADSSLMDVAEGSLLGNSTTDLGTSALDTTTDLANTVEEEVNQDTAGADETMDDDGFRPDLEGTPLPGRLDQSEQVRRQSIYHSDDELYALSPKKSRGTKRKSDDISSDHDIVTLARTQDQTTQGTMHGTEVEVLRSSPPVEERRQSRTPLSSDLSPARSPGLPPLSDGHSAKSSTPRRVDLDSETYASPRSSSSLEARESPSPKKRRGAPFAETQTRRVTSAMLRQMLPRRVVQQDQGFDVSGLESSDVEPESPKRSKRRGRKVLGEVKGKKNVKVGAKDKVGGKKNAARTTVGHGKENADATIGIDSTSKHKRNEGKSKTYGRRKGENSDGEGSDGDEGLSKELQAARDKFRQIDQGALDFESASISGGSSPWR